MGPRCLLGKVRHNLGVSRARCSQPDGDSCSPDICCRYLVGAWIGWYQSRCWSGNCGGKKKQLTRDQRLLMIFFPRPTSVGGVWLGPVSVQDIWSRYKSVEDIDDLNNIPGGIRPCGYVRVR